MSRWSEEKHQSHEFASRELKWCANVNVNKPVSLTRWFTLIHLGAALIQSDSHCTFSQGFTPRIWVLQPRWSYYLIYRNACNNSQQFTAACGLPQKSISQKTVHKEVYRGLKFGACHAAKIEETVSELLLCGVIMSIRVMWMNETCCYDNRRVCVCVCERVFQGHNTHQEHTHLQHQWDSDAHWCHFHSENTRTHAHTHAHTHTSTHTHAHTHTHTHTQS